MIVNRSRNNVPDTSKFNSEGPAGLTEAGKMLSTVIAESGLPEPPSTGEWSMTGSQRLFGPQSPFNSLLGLGYYSSANIPLNVLDVMRRDNQVALGMAIVKFPITQLKFTLNCKNPLIKEFVKHNLENIWSKFVCDSLKSLDFGFSAFEKVWSRKILTIDPGLNTRKARDRDFICLEKIKPLSPTTISVRVDSHGNFAGINQDQTGEKIILPRNKSMIVTNDEEYGNFFGKPRLVSAYEPWYWKQISTQFFLRYMERFSIPPYKVSYPQGITRMGGQQFDHSVIATNMATAISSFGNVAIPSARDDKGNRKWDIEALSSGNVVIKTDEYVGFWNIQILRGLLIPDKVSLDAMDEETASQVFLSTLAPIVQQIEAKANTEIIEPLVAWNFTEEERAECKLNIDDIDFKKRSEMRKLMSKILDLSATYFKNSGGLPFNKFPDISRIFDILDIPQVDTEINIPKTVGDLKNAKVNKGLQKGEKTEGNKSREDRDGNPRDIDKELEQEVN